MATEIITREDLQEFSEQLLNRIKRLLGQVTEEPRKWLKSYQVKNLLKISDNPSLHFFRCTIDWHG